MDDDKQEVVVTVSRLRSSDEEGGEWHEVQGQARLVVTDRTRYRYGQPVEVTGRLATPPDFEEFSYREVLARRGIHSHFYAAKVVVQEGPMQGTAWRLWLYDVRSRSIRHFAKRRPSWLIYLWAL